MRPAVCCSNPHHHHHHHHHRHVEQYKDNLNTLPNEEPSELKFSIDIEEPSLPPLWVAAQKGDVGEVLKLIKEGCDVNCTNPVDGSTPLLAALLEGHTAVSSLLLKLQATDVHASNSAQQFPLAIVCADGHTHLASHLIDRGASVNQRAAGGTPLIAIAAQNHHTEIVQLLLIHGADATAKSDNGTTALMSCCKNAGTRESQLDVVRLLIPFSDVNATDKNGYTALHYAVMYGHEDVVKELVQSGRAQTTISGFDGMTPFLLACARGSLELAKLLRPGVSTLDTRKSDGWHALHFAVAANNFELAQYICLEDPLLVNISDKLGVTALLLAVEKQNIEIVRLLLQRGAKTTPAQFNEESFVSDTWEPPIVAAATVGDVRIMRMLVDCGADVNVASPHDGHTALLEAVMEKNLEAVTFLLEQGANPNVISSDKLTPLIEATRGDLTDIAQKLLEYGASPTLATEIGAPTPLHIAAFEGFAGTLKLLASAAETVDPQDEDGTTPLMLAAQENRVDAIDILLDCNAEIDLQDCTGSTALIAAVAAGRVEAAERLLSRGAQVNIANNRGCTPLWIAAAEGNAKLVEMLMSYGSDPTIIGCEAYTPVDIALKCGYADIASQISMLHVQYRNKAASTKMDVDGL